MSIFTPEQLRLILQRRPQAEWGAARFARSPDRYRGKIDQINRLWDELPADWKEALEPRILATADRTFRGALSEIIAYRVLREFYFDVRTNPRVGNSTPDFHVVQNDNRRAFIAEVFSLGPHAQDKAYYRACGKLRRALRDFVSPYHLSFRVSPTTYGDSLDWLPGMLEPYLAGPIQAEDHETVHRLSNENQHVFFKVGPRVEGGTQFWGFQGQNIRGNPQAANLTGKLEDKAAKYKFPFVAVCVTDGLGTADRHALMEALFGRVQMRIPVVIDGGPPVEARVGGWEFDDNGFWGINDPQIGEHLGVQALLFIEPEHRADQSFSLRIHLVENPHIHASLGSDFNGVPELLDHARHHGTYDVEGFQLEP